MGQNGVVQQPMTAWDNAPFPTGPRQLRNKTHKPHKFDPVIELKHPLRCELWSRITMIADVNTGQLARPFARSLAQLTHLLASHCLCATLRSLVHCRALGKVNDSMSQNPAALILGGA